MIFADKLVRLRRKNGWSQEDLADKMEVSRQAVSKWESAQSVPDLDKILRLSDLFGVTTDYLLRDELEDEEFTDGPDASPVRRVTLAQANDFLAWRKSAARRIATGVFLCVTAVIPLLLLAAATRVPACHVSENVAAGVGLVSLLALVAGAVATFILCGARNAPYEFLDKEPFETEYGITGMVRERQKAYKGAYTRLNVLGACICVLSPIPLLLGAFTEREVLTVILLAVTLALAGVGAVCFILAGVPWASMEKLLQEGDFTPARRRQSRAREAVATAYWLGAVAVYLGWSFLTGAWETTWVVWPVAGVLYAVVMCLCNLFLGREKPKG